MSQIDYESVSLLLHRAQCGCDRSRDQLMDQLQSYLGVVAKQNTDQRVQQKFGNSDIVQRSMVNVIENFDNFRGTTHGEFKAWLKQILINEIRKIRRDFSRAKRDLNREVTLDPVRPGLAGSLEDPDPTPQTTVQHSEMLSVMKTRISELPEDYQTVIQLRSLERLPFKEVGKLMDRSPDAATKLWYRAVLQLQALMKESE